MKVEILPATIEHIEHLGQHMREADRHEVMASHGLEGIDAAMESVRLSRQAFCGLVDGVPVYLFGFSLMKDGRGIVWGLGTDALGAHVHRFLRASHNFISFCRGQATVLENWVHSDNVESLAWLRWLGFQVDEAAPYGVAGELFHHVHMTGGFFSLAERPKPTPFRQVAPEHRLPEELSTPEKRREYILKLEGLLAEQMKCAPGNTEEFPLTHRFADGIYVREITIPANTILTGRIHKHAHPNFLLEGEVSMITEEGGVVRMSAPQSLISPAGCKRAIFTHTATRWTTIHKTDTTDPTDIEDELAVTSYEALEHFQALQLEERQ